LTPAPAQDLDGDYRAAVRVVGPEDAAEAPRGDPIEQTIAAQEVSFSIPLDELLGLPWSQIALPLESAEELVALDAGICHLVANVTKMRIAQKAQLNCLLGQGVRVTNYHECSGFSTAEPSPTWGASARFHPF